MRYKSFVSMDIAVVGSGETAAIFAASFAIAGHEVYFAQRPGGEPLVSPVLSAFSNIHFCTIESASAKAEIIILAIPPEDVREVAYWLGDVTGKVIIDSSANACTGNGALNTLAAIHAITGNKDIVKVFNTREYQKILLHLFKDESVRMVMVGGNQKSKELMKIMAGYLNIKHFRDLGGDEAVPIFDAMTRSWCELRRSSSGREMKRLARQ